MATDEQLQLELSLEGKPAQEAATKAIDAIEKEVSSLTEGFEKQIDSVQNLGEAMKLLAATHTATSAVVNDEVKKTGKEFEKKHQKEKTQSKFSLASGKAMKVVWGDLKSGIGAATKGMTSLLGVGAALGPISVAGGAVALFFGSLLTIDAIDAAVKNVGITAATLVGKFGLVSDKTGKLSKNLTEYKDRVHALEGAYDMSTKQATQTLAAYTGVGFAVEDLDKKTVKMAAGWDYLLGQPVGTWMNKVANDAKEFGMGIDYAANAVTELQHNFAGFIAEGRAGAITVVDLQSSMETASRTMAGWSSDWTKLVDYQKDFIKAGEAAGLSTAGAAKAFGGFIGEVDRLDMGQMQLLYQTMFPAGQGEGAGGSMQAAIDKLADTFGGGTVGRALAMQTFAKRTGEGQPGADFQSEFYSSISKAMLALGDDKNQQVMILKKTFGLSQQSIVTFLELSDAMKKAQGDPKKLAKLSEEQKGLLAQAAKDAADRRRDLPTKIKMGIAAWWREIAPDIFSTFINGFGIIYESIQWLIEFFKGDKRDPDKMKFLEGQIADRQSLIAESIKNIAEVTVERAKKTKEQIAASIDAGMMGRTLAVSKNVYTAKDRPVSPEEDYRRGHSGSGGGVIMGKAWDWSKDIIGMAVGKGIKIMISPEVIAGAVNQVIDERFNSQVP